MIATLEMPQLSGGRKRARALAATVGPVRHQELVVDCRQLLAGTESFAEELIRTVLVEQDASQLSFVNVDDDFADYLAAAARDMHVEDRVSIDRVSERRAR